MPTLILLFTAAAGIQLVCWILLGMGFRRATELEPSASSPGSTPVSVIVAVRNGAHSLPALFRALAAQVHTNFEVVVVDDHSTDGTAPTVRASAAEDPRIHLVSSLHQGKKAALTVGVETAAHDILAFTDADCIPEPEWLSMIVHLHARSDEGIVAGYGPYVSGTSLLNRLVRYETLHTALLLASAIGLGRPYMAVGRNLSYRKSTFLRLGGHERTSGLLSGDDDLFVQDASAAGTPIRFMANGATFVYSEAPESLIEWLRQKRRHLSAGRGYRLVPGTALVVYHLSALMCWMAPFVVGWVGFGCLLCRLFPARIVLRRVSSVFREAGLAYPFVLLDLAFQAYLILVAPLAWFMPPKRW